MIDWLHTGFQQNAKALVQLGLFIAVISFIAGRVAAVRTQQKSNIDQSDSVGEKVLLKPTIRQASEDQ